VISRLGAEKTGAASLYDPGSLLVLQHRLLAWSSIPGSLSPPPYPRSQLGCTFIETGTLVVVVARLAFENDWWVGVLDPSSVLRWVIDCRDSGLRSCMRPAC